MYDFCTFVKDTTTCVTKSHTHTNSNLALKSMKLIPVTLQPPFIALKPFHWWHPLPPKTRPNSLF